MSAYLGHIAGLGASLIWSITPIFFTSSSRQVGAALVNRTRLLFAVVFVSLMHWLVQGQPFPAGVELFRWGWLALSGVIGFALGDSFLFEAFVRIGPRLAMLLMALAPVLSTIMGWGLLHEAPSGYEALGILVTVGGVVLVVSDRQNGQDGDAQNRSRHDYLLGVLSGIGAALGQAGGLVASRLGLVGSFPALTGTLIRLMAATLVIWMLALLRREAMIGIEKLKEHPRALLAILIGAAGGPFIGVWLSLIAVQNAPLGVASTLTSLSPVMLLPVGYLLYRERIGVRAIAGTILAVAGTAVLFL